MRVRRPLEEQRLAARSVAARNRSVIRSARAPVAARAHVAVGGGERERLPYRQGELEAEPRAAVRPARSTSSRAPGRGRRRPPAGGGLEAEVAVAREPVRRGRRRPAARQHAAQRAGLRRGQRDGRRWRTRGGPSAGSARRSGSASSSQGAAPTDSPGGRAGRRPRGRCGDGGRLGTEATLERPRVRSGRCASRIDARAAAEVPAGRGRYVRELLRALARLDATTPTSCWPATLGRRGARRALPLARGRRAASRSGGAARAARAARGADAVLATNCYLLAALARAAVTMVYDLVRLRPGAAARRAARAVERVTLPLAVRRARDGRCASRRRRARRSSPAPARGRATARGDPARRRAALPRRPDDGGRRPRAARARAAATCSRSGRSSRARTCRALIEAFAGLPPALRDRSSSCWRARAAGATERDAAPARARGDGALARLRRATTTCPALYAGARCSPYPSLDEGFGLPVLEAMAAGTPVLTSDGSSLPEVGGDAVRYVDPRSVDRDPRRPRRLLEDAPRRARWPRPAGPGRAAFTWERTARETLAVVEDRARGGVRGAPRRPARRARRCGARPAATPRRAAARGRRLRPSARTRSTSRA